MIKFFVMFHLAYYFIFGMITLGFPWLLMADLVNQLGLLGLLVGLIPTTILSTWMYYVR